MSELPSTLLYVFLISTMLAIGLEVSGGEILAALNSRSQLVRALFANLVVMPVFGWLITKTIRLEPSTTAAILLVAAAPGGLRALQFTGKVKDNIYFAAGLMLILTFVAIVITPFLVSLLLIIETPYNLPYGRIVIFVLVFLLLPLAVGHLINRSQPDLANLAKRPTLLISNISFVATIVLTLALNRRSTSAIGTRGVVAILIMIVGGLIASWVFGGPAKGTRRGGGSQWGGNF